MPVVNISDELNTRELPRDGYKPPPQQYPQRIINSSLYEQGSLYSVKFSHCHQNYHAFTSYSTKRHLIKIWSTQGQDQGQGKGQGHGQVQDLG